MAIAPAVLWGPLQVTDVAGPIYTAPANSTIVITRAVFTNSSGSNATLTVWVVRSGDSRANSRILIGAVPGGQVITAGPSEPYIANALANLVLSGGDAIHALSGTTNVINTVASGWKQ